MVWFKVDDKLHSHSKIRKVLAEDPAALALWVVAGSWSSDNLTDGFVPDHQLPWLIPSGADELAQKLVAARLWRRVRGGHQFHEWDVDGDGTKRNPTKNEVENERRKKAEAGRKGGLASGKTRSRTEAPGSASASASAKARAAQIVEPPTRPDRREGRGTGDLLGGTAVTRASPEPPPRCPKHLDDPEPPPCGPCADARRAHERWELAEAERKRTMPKCSKHRGQPADGCGLCRADQLAAPDPTADTA